MDAMRITGLGSRIALGAAADLDRARPPRVGACEVIYDDRRSAGTGDVAELLRVLEVPPSDFDRVVLGVVGPADRDHVRLPP